MKRYIDSEKLKAEIERRMGMHRKASADGYIIDPNRLDEDEDILSLVTSLQQEQPDGDLEKEIDVCWKNWLSPSNQKDVEGVLPKTEFAMYARHFYELGLNSRKEG